MANLRMFGFDEWSLLPNNNVPAALLQADGISGHLNAVKRGVGRFGIGHCLDYIPGWSTNNVILPIGVNMNSGGGIFSFAFRNTTFGGVKKISAYNSFITNNNTSLMYPIGVEFGSDADVSCMVGNTRMFRSVPGYVPLNQWQWVVFKWEFGEPGAAKAQFYINGNILASYTSLTIPGNINGLRIAGTQFDDAFQIDDILIQDLTGPAPNNDILGNIRVGAQVVNGPGDLTEFSVSGAPSNWQANLNIAMDPSIYVSTDTVGDTDLYTLAANIPARTIYGIQAKGVFYQNNSTQLFGANAVKIGGTEYVGTSLGLSSGVKSQYDLWDTNPTTGTQFINEDLSLVQIGPALTGSE